MHTFEYKGTMKHIRVSLLLVILIVSVFTLASCKEQTYKITFDTMTDATINAIEAPAGDAIFAPSEPVREGYRFDGWLFNDELFLFGLMPDDDIQLTAKWSKYYKIFFDTDGGTTIDPITIAEGDPIVLPDYPTKSHYKCIGWSYLGEPLELTTMISGDMMINAIWTEATTISFDTTVFDVFLDQYVDIVVEDLIDIAGTPISAPMVPNYIGYKFLSWNLDGEEYIFTTMPETDITLSAEWLQLSNLPAMFINLYDEQSNVIPLDNVNREVYVKSTITLENTVNDFQINNASALFRGRGNGSWVDSGDKKGYRIKFDEKQSILGNDESRHWVILANANFDDVTMYRNKLAYNMATEIFTSIDYVSSAEWIDVYVNGEYQGVYLIAEQIRVDNDRIDIDSEFGILDTGYLIEYDAYATGINGVDYFRVDGLRYPFTMKSPDPADYLEAEITLEQYKAQVAFIQEMVQDMVDAVMAKDMVAFEEVADMASFVDMYILHELFKNIDTGYSSFYIYRAPGGKLTATAPWDFDATCGSSPTRGNGGPEGIYVGLQVQAFSSRTASELLITLYDTPVFRTAIEERWAIISPEIQQFIDDTLTDDMIEANRFAMGRNFVKWPTPQGYGTPKTQIEAEDDWEANIIRLRNWMTDRITWLDGEWSLTEE